MNTIQVVRHSAGETKIHVIKVSFSQIPEPFLILYFKNVLAMKVVPMDVTVIVLIGVVLRTKPENVLRTHHVLHKETAWIWIQTTRKMIVVMTRQMSLLALHLVAAGNPFMTIQITILTALTQYKALSNRKLK